MHDYKKKKHVNATTISAEDYLRNEMLKAYQPQASDKFNEVIDHFTYLHRHEQSKVMETEGNDMTANTLPNR